MKIILDTDVCKKEGIDIDVALYLASLYAGFKITPATFHKARDKDFVIFSKPYDVNEPFPDYVDISELGDFIIESVLAKSNSNSRNSLERFTKLAEKLREVFPVGKKPGYAYTWRDSVSCIADRLQKFTMKYGDYPDEDIIKATKDYVNSFNGDYKYMQLLKYFIWKNKVTGETEREDGRLIGEVEKQSQLAAYLEDKESSTTINQDWSVKLC